MQCLIQCLASALRGNCSQITRHSLFEFGCTTATLRVSPKRLVIWAGSYERSYEAQNLRRHTRSLIATRPAATNMVLSPRSAELGTRSATARLGKRRAELDKLQTTSHAFKEARSVVPRGTGPDKLWFKSGQYWGKAYTIGLILKHEGLPIADSDPCFVLPKHSSQKRAWEEMQAASRAPSAEEQPRKKHAVAAE